MNAKDYVEEIWSHLGSFISSSPGKLGGPYI